MQGMTQTRPVEEVFHVLGYFEEIGIQVGLSFRSLGTRKIENPQPARPLGVYGQREYILTEDIELTKGHKKVKIRASKSKPVRCFGIANALCGRVRT